MIGVEEEEERSKTMCSDICAEAVSKISEKSSENRFKWRHPVKADHGIERKKWTMRCLSLKLTSGAHSSNDPFD